MGSIFGNLTIAGAIDSQSAIVAGGSIGGPKGKFSAGSISGIVAAVGSINIGQTGTTNTALYDEANDTLDAAVIDSIFSQGVLPLGPSDSFDRSIALDLGNLSQILSNLNSLKVVTVNSQKKLAALSDVPSRRRHEASV